MLRRMPAMLVAICASVSSWRASSRNDGSPMRVVPPPISATGLWPCFCNSRSSMICTMLADMQAVRRAVEADIAGDRAGREGRVQRRLVGALEDEAAGFRLAQEVAVGHGCFRLTGAG